MFDACSPHVDNVFGPWVSGCRKGFDFTLLFEQAIFSIIPSGLIIISGIFRLWKLGRHTPKIKAGLGSWLILWKQIVIICLTATQLALTILWASPTSHPTDVSLGASVLSLAATVLLVWLSFLEHDRSIRPSTVIQLFLLFSIVLDLPQARTLWLRHDNEEIAGLFATGLVLKLCGLLLEMVEKRRFLRHRYSNSAPESLAGIINISLLWWLNPLLIRGYSTILDLPALFNLSTELTSRDLQPRFRQTWAAADKERPHALIKVTAVCLWKPLLSTVVPRLLVICFKICQPLLTEKAVSLLSQPDSQYNTNVGRALIGATALTYIGMALMIARYKHNTYRLICMVRGGLVGLIYDATLQLGATAAEQSAAITLMDTDIERIVYGLELMDSLWAGPIEIAVALYLLSRQIGIFCLTAAVLAIIFIFCPLALSPFSRSAQRSWNQAVQERVAATASVLGHIRAVKIMGVTESLQTRLHDLRIRELQISARFRGILSVVITLNGMLRSVVPAASLVLYVLVTNGSTSGSFNPTVAFTSLSLIALITDPVKLISRAITPMAGSVGCFQRVQEYLTSYQVSHDRVSRMSCSNCQSTDEKPFKSPSVAIEEDAVLRLKDADFAYDQVPEHCALRDISIRLQPSSCTMIVGPVGSGKSTLLLALLNELHLTRGCFHTPRSLTIGYCAQNPWLPHLSIREIITGSSDFDDAWYSTIVQTCALTVDIENMADGDETLVGSQGARMSGGQRQRLSLARALYARPQLLLLDDVLSGLDTSTEQIVVDSILGADGVCRRNNMTVVLVTNKVSHTRLADGVIRMHPTGCIAQQGPPSEMDLRQDICFTKSEVSEHTKKSKDAPDNSTLLKNPDFEKPPDSSWRASGSITLYWYYFRALGWCLTMACLVIDIISSFSIKFPTALVRWWSDSEVQHPGVHTNLYVGLYIMFCVLNFLAFAGMSYLVLQIAAPRSSIRLHSALLSTVMAAPLWLFTSLDSGQLLNRFSQDMSLIDMDLPLALMDFLFSLAGCIAEAGLIVSASKWAALILPVLLFVLYIIQKFYLRSSRQLRLLDLEAKTPLYSHFLETLQGLTTIRAFGWQRPKVTKNNEYIDSSQKPYYLLYIIQCWLGLVLDMTVAGLATFIMALATQLPSSSAGSLGVSLVSILSFSQSLCYLVQFWAHLETSLGAVARVKRFEEETPSEHLPDEKMEPPEMWPMKGDIRFSDVAATYKPDLEPVLKGLSLHVQPGQKVAICGRTGRYFI
ncbi:hypothetical protein AWENTII_009447 [Aspergillus wentii]